jgi:hypothetical protein
MTYFGANSFSTVANYLSGGVYAFVGLNENGSVSNQVVLGFSVDYLSNGTTLLSGGDFSANTVLVHEMLHVYTGFKDAKLAAKLGRTGANSRGMGASEWISWELQHNCPDVK